MTKILIVAHPMYKMGKRRKNLSTWKNRPAIRTCLRLKVTNTKRLIMMAKSCWTRRLRFAVNSRNIIQRRSLATAQSNQETCCPTPREDSKTNPWEIWLRAAQKKAQKRRPKNRPSPPTTHRSRLTKRPYRKNPAQKVQKRKTPQATCWKQTSTLW